MMTDQRAKVLLVAYACRPGESSEREVGWRWSRLIQQRHDVTVLTRATHRPHIEAWLAEHGAEGAPEFIYYDLPERLMRFKRGERGLYLYYALWTFLAIRMTRKMNAGGRWNITHFLTFGTLIWPQFSYRMKTPYVFGPVGGGERIPLSLRRAFGPAGQLKIIARWLVQNLLRLNPLFWANLIQADHIFARTGETRAIIPARFRGKTELLLETAIDPELTQSEPPVRNNQMLEIVSVGRLITSKFNPLMLEVLADFKKRYGKPFRMTIIGDGPERARLEALRDALKLDEVVFTGKQPGEAVFDALKRSDIYFSTTMKEGGTWAFFEAISMHLPIVCLKVNGPDMIVGDECGVKVPPVNYAQTREGLAEGLLTLAQDPQLRASHAAKALTYIEKTYAWDRVLTRIDAVYRAILDNEKTPRA